MNRGDTLYLLLNYQVNGRNLVQGAYEEIELQLNNQSSSASIKKLLSDGDIVWKKVTYNGGSFTGYVVHLTQAETFTLRAGETSCQLRIKMNGEVGASEISDFDLESVLSTQVL